MAKPQPRIDDATGQAIVDAAFRLCTVNPQTSLADIAREAHVGMSAIYARFSNRHHLIAHLFFDILDNAIAVTKHALDSPSLYDSNSFVQYFLSLVDVRAGSLSYAWGRSVPEEYSTGIAQRASELIDVLDQLLSRYRDAGTLSNAVTPQSILCSLEAVHAYGAHQHSNDRATTFITHTIAWGLTHAGLPDVLSGPISAYLPVSPET